MLPHIRLWAIAVSYTHLEQNEQGVGFYQHLGFEVVGRSALDEQGNPFPILHLKHKESC